MNFQGKTVLLLVGLSIIISSFVTMMVTSTDADQIPINENDTSAEQGGLGDNGVANDGIADDLPQHIAEKFDKIEDTYKIISQNYLFEVDEGQLFEGAIEGMINTLEDPYSVYMDPDQAEQFNSSLRSSFEGIGAEVMLQDNRVTVVSPIRGAPAEKAGIRPNDQIISVNGENVEGMDLNEAVLKIRGPKGSEAVLEIDRPGLSELLTISVVRDEIPVETVYSETIRAEGKRIGKIEIASFAQKTAEDFEKALLEHEKNGIDGLVIDVRGNPGGYLDAVRDIGMQIVPDENIITEIVTREGQKMVYRSTLKGRKSYPITILVNQGSASASEILAAALQEAGNYKVVGMNSFGKGTVQSTLQMEDTSEIKITMAKWLTPDENWINETGVQPDVEIEQPDYFHVAPIQITDGLVLERDMNNKNVGNMQIILQGLGYAPGRNDGFFDTRTEQAVQSFQTKNQLEVTGVVDEETVNLMHEQLIEAIRDPQNDLQLQRAVEVLLEEIK